ncbi:UNKNOWN [Stylonychia lemnae]|uniref:SANT and BTB domain-containing protein n=1 Tax=Stylonychia lemnae TaxID=5949 RepID=A0A078AZS4_STYLE|nr:UNKNOWN [Stylonychia lemnae]|eukprot:CDW87596.1 UNKNOWN [Stylonychia lemnae]
MKWDNIAETGRDQIQLEEILKEIADSQWRLQKPQNLSSKRNANDSILKEAKCNTYQLIPQSRFRKEDSLERNQSLQSQIRGTNKTQALEEFLKQEQNSVEIEVEDPKFNQKKIIRCLKEVIYQQIPYFEKYLREEQKGYLVKIQVLSDIHVFDWIMQFAENCFYHNLPDRMPSKRFFIQNKSAFDTAND